ncbi:unnamed protein product [Hyaloperonospora brassicae]|uniref:Protein kinase domain-containing protein n=1 Tax=Hyaloperonospora brassicae TaxID=162125 RepID=A0AAV0TQU9_HYABA|nr:unnamed protein product [Hyaloperonospora brassicae]
MTPVDSSNSKNTTLVDVWYPVHWVCLAVAAVSSLYLLLHSVTFHRLKRRMADLLLCGIAVADLAFVGSEAIKQLLHTSYVARYRQKQHEDGGGGGDPSYDTSDFLLTLVGRASFFMSLYWIANLSLLMRRGSFEALRTKKSLLLSSLASLVYGCMHAVLLVLASSRDRKHMALAYTTTAVLLLSVQTTPLLLLVTNLWAVKTSRLVASTHGRNAIRRLVAYCVTAAVCTLPSALVLVFSQHLVPLGAVAETLNYVVPVANALLFGTSLSCCCHAAETERTTLPSLDKKRSNNDTLLSSIDISAGVDSVDGNGVVIPDSTNETVCTTNGMSLGYKDGIVLAGGPFAEMETEGLAVMIGEGSSAEVYKAQWLGITVALKCLRVQAKRSRSSEADLYMTHLAELHTEFLEEAVLAAQLRHPNITLFIKMGTYKGSLCLVNEYCARGSLRDVLRANPFLEWNTKVRLAFEAAKGLAFMHNCEPIYLHRDLKASNILVTADWTAKIADFGISRIATDYTVQKNHLSHKCSLQSLQSIDESDIMADGAASELRTTFAGTWRWNAPEIMRNPNECHFNRETDIYSFGVALWEILTNGAIPFGDVDFDHQVRQLVAAGERPTIPPIYLQRAPPEFVEVMCACWHQRPAKRPKAQDVMLRLGLLSSTLSRVSELFSSPLNTARGTFGDNNYHSMNSNHSCPGLW